MVTKNKREFKYFRLTPIVSEVNFFNTSSDVRNDIITIPACTCILQSTKILFK